MRGFIKIEEKNKGELLISINAIAYVENKGDKGVKIYVNSFRGELDTIFYCDRPFFEVESLIANASE